MTASISRCKSPKNSASMSIHAGRIKNRQAPTASTMPITPPPRSAICGVATPARWWVSLRTEKRPVHRRPRPAQARVAKPSTGSTKTQPEFQKPSCMERGPAAPISPSDISPASAIRQSRLAHSVDVRGDGGYAVAWWAHGCPVICNAPRAPMPEWLAKAAMPPPPPAPVPYDGEPARPSIGSPASTASSAS